VTANERTGSCHTDPVADEDITVSIAGEDVRITSPDKVMFPRHGWTKRDVVNHFLTCVDGALTGVFGRPTLLKRWPNGVGAKPFYQKRAPESATERIVVPYPSGRSAAYLVPRSPADVIWMAQLNCLDLNPWTSRAEHVERPDELRIDLDPTPQATFADVRDVALVVREVLADHGLVGWPKTSGSKGMHVYVRIHPQWSFSEVRRAALAVGREVEAEVPELATTAWWKDERHGVFIDYNQNTRDHSIASAYSVRPTGYVSAPLTWEEVPDAEPQDFPMVAFADRYRRVGDLMEGIDGRPGSIAGLLETADAQDAEDAP
jgi:DNA ligase D-like protein (predicted polymerase)